MASTKDYSSIYSIKDFAINTVAPKYFDMNSVNQLNVGLLGYATELIANTTEDTFNSISTFVREIFPNQAQIPETLYSYAANLNIGSLFATPSELNLVLFVNERDIINLGSRKDIVTEFVLDSDLIVDVEGKQFMLDYDIMITAKQYGTDYIYTAQYDISYKNSVSNITNPYLKTTRITMNGSKYLGIVVKMHQMNKFEQTEFILNNDKINLPTLSFNYIDQLADFDVFYKPSGDSNYTQLKKLMYGSTPSRQPFCYYKIKDENQIEVTFTMRDNYFQPEFNSEILFKIYTTSGKAGDFPEYKGSNIAVIPKSSVYEYNNAIIVFAIAQGESAYGADKLTLEDLRSKIIEKNATSGAYNVESDLQLYFSNYQYRDNNEVLFVKKRDDALERIFSAFSLFKDYNNDYFPTNTVNIDLYKSDFDLEYEQSDQYVLKTGHLFKYQTDSNDKVEMIPGKTVLDDLSTINEPFLYSNPFLITIKKNPTIVGFYLNSVLSKLPLDYSYVNSDSYVQFICNSIDIQRNALNSDDKYTMTITIIPTTQIDAATPILDTSGIPTGRLKVMLAFEESGVETCYTEFSFVSFDQASNVYTYQTTLKTDDYMSIERLRVIDVFNIEDGSVETKLVPMYNGKLNINAFFKYDGLKVAHKYDMIDSYYDYTLTNTYTTDPNPVNLMTPIDIMRTQVKYIPYKRDDGAGNMVDDFFMRLSYSPLVGASTLKDGDKFAYFLNLMYSQYNYLLGAIDKITNNYGLDLKFYNTFGKSKNFVVGENNERLDRVNIKIHFKIAPNIGVIEEILIRDLKIFIKEYIEGINNKGYNAIYISNLISAIQTNFSDVKYLKFVNINNYDSSVQVIENLGFDLNALPTDERRNYVPEYLTLGLDDITIDIIRN
jgi:hypothetical protein